MVKPERVRARSVEEGCFPQLRRAKPQRKTLAKVSRGDPGTHWKTPFLLFLKDFFNRILSSEIIEQYIFLFNPEFIQHLKDGFEHHRWTTDIVLSIFRR